MPTAERRAAIYILHLPDDPEIRQQGSRNCAICGMALEPLEVTAEAAPNHDLTDMTRRFWARLALTLPVVVLEAGGHIPDLGLLHFVPPQVSTLVQLLLATPVVNRSLNMFTLIVLGTGAAHLCSAVVTLAPDVFPEGTRGMDGTVAI